MNGLVVIHPSLVSSGIDLELLIFLYAYGVTTLRGSPGVHDQDHHIRSAGVGLFALNMFAAGAWWLALRLMLCCPPFLLGPRMFF